MRITCPNCQATYEVGESDIPEDGIEVECSACLNRWMQMPKSEEIAPEPEPESPPVEPSVEPAQPEMEDESAGAEPEISTEPESPEPEVSKTYLMAHLQQKMKNESLRWLQFCTRQPMRRTSPI